MLIASPRTEKTKLINHGMQYPAERVHKIFRCLY